MSIHRYPGNFRVGVLDEPRDGVLDGTCSSVEPKAMIFVLLSGYQEFRLGAEHITLDAAGGAAGLLMRINRPVAHQFVENHGSPLTKISIATSLDWIDGLETAGSGPLTLSAPDLVVRPFMAGPETTAIARDICQAETPMRRMSLGVSLLERVITAQAGVAPAPIAEAPNALLRRLQAELRRNQHSAQSLAKACGIGLRTLERQVQQEIGRSLGQVLRREKLRLGQQALMQGAGLASAAHRAGYRSSASFSSAFKREFGQPPQETGQQAQLSVW